MPAPFARPVAICYLGAVTADPHNDSWYVRRGSTIQGPFDVETLHRYLLLGRVRLTDRVSADGHTWMPLTQRLELIPEEMRDLESAEGRARFEAARRAVDERGDEGGGWSLAAARRRRRNEDRAGGLPGTRTLLALGAIAAAVVLAAIGYHDTWLHGPAGPPDCDAAPGPGVNWSYCTKDGLALEPGTDLGGLRAVNASLRDTGLAGVRLRDATLAYANLTNANLARADLRGADLEGAVLRGADLSGARLDDASLSHADLRNATITDAGFDGAEIANVVWPDGRACSSGSAEECLE